MKSIMKIIFLLFCSSLLAAPIKKNSPNRDTLVLQHHGISFTKLPSWHYIRTVPNKKKVFDLIRLYKSYKANKNRRSIHDHIAARAYLEIIRPSSQRLITVAKNKIRSARIQGFTVLSREIRKEKKTHTFFFALFYKAQDKKDRNIWTSIRFFRAQGKIYMYSGAAYSKKELSSIDVMFKTLRFFTPKKSKNI